MKLFDSHCHLEDERFEGEVPQALERMREAGVERCILAGSNEADCLKILALIRQYPDRIWAVLGYHPHDAKDWNEGSEAKLSAWLRESNVLGIGEIGLDYYYDLSPRDVQKEVFQKQLGLAYRLHCPAVLHIRDAHGDTLEILKAQKELPTCVLHCFSGSVEVAQEYLKLGCYISFAGPLTFKNAAKLPEVAKMVPEDRFLIETDSPYLAPVPMRGRRNEPAYVRYVAEKIAEIRGITPEEAAAAAWRNTCRLYRLEENI